MGLSDISPTEERFKSILFSYPHSISTVTYITTTPEYYNNFSLIFDLLEPLISLYLIIMVILVIFLGCFVISWKKLNVNINNLALLI